MMRVAPAKFHLPVILIIAGLISCKTQEATSPAQRYYYYPKTNTYYDAAALEYIYSLDSGRNWVKMKTAAESTRPALGEEVSIKETGDEIWLENETHRNMYGGTLYNVISRDTALLTAEKPKEIKKPVAKQDSAVSSPKKKRNIFQKIFGKKKN